MSDASLSPSPIPVTLVARVDTLAAAATGPARLASPPAGRLASRTPISMSTPIPPSPADGTTFDFSVSDVSVSRSLEFALPSATLPGATLPGASADRGHAEASAFADSRADSEGTIGSSEFGGLPGAESFLRDAAAQRAWDVVVGLIASDASVDDDDASNSSFARAGSSDRSAGGSGTATGGSLSGRSGDTDGSSLATLPGAEQWLRSAETERREAKREGREGRSSPGSGNASSGGESASRLGRVSGASALSGSDRSGSLDTLPGGDEWLTSPGARGALDAYAREGVRAPFEDDAEGDAEGQTRRVSPSDGTDGSTATRAETAKEKRALRKKSSPTDTLGVLNSPSPPPPSDSQLADELRQKINRLRVAARHSDDVVATVRSPSPLSLSLSGNAESPRTSRSTETDPSLGSSSLDPTTVSVAKSDVEVAYERFAGVMRAAPRLPEDTAISLRDRRSPEREMDAAADETAYDSFHDALDATARSSSFASAGEGAGAFDADALVSSTFEDVFGDGDGSGDGSESGGGDDRGDGGEDARGDDGSEDGDLGPVAVPEAT